MLRCYRSVGEILLYRLEWVHIFWSITNFMIVHSSIVTGAGTGQLICYMSEYSPLALLLIKGMLPLEEHIITVRRTKYTYTDSSEPHYKTLNFFIFFQWQTFFA